MTVTISTFFFPAKPRGQFSPCSDDKLHSSLSARTMSGWDETVSDMYSSPNG